MQRAIQAQLNRIVGLPLWAIGRAASLLWLQFGERHTVPAWRQGTKQVGALALHVDCPWYWKRGDQIVASWRSEFELAEKLVLQPTGCRTAIAQESGSFELQFDNNTTFVTTVEDDADPDADEYWRLLEPALDTPHFVVGARRAGT
jgi:hypothetical protein